MDLQFGPGAVTVVMISAVTASFITNNGRSAWFIGVLLVFIYATFASDALYRAGGSARTCVSAL
jgi:Ca2+:H+ antiporter